MSDVCACQVYRWSFVYNRSVIAIFSCILRFLWNTRDTGIKRNGNHAETLTKIKVAAGCYYHPAAVPMRVWTRTRRPYRSVGVHPMQFYGKAETAAQRILDVFKNGSLPDALAPVFIHRRDNTPCRAWSWSNQLLTALAGHSDARGFRQWEQAGRRVRKGEHAFAILGPCTRKVKVRDDETGEERERLAVYGFKSIPVFGRAQTDVFDADRWAEASREDREAQQFIDALPLVSVARAWGLSVETYNARAGGALGRYRGGSGIALGVENAATWAHELIHAADDRLGHLTERGQHLDSETVAELGGAVLLKCLGLEHDADLGGCWRYIESYAARKNQATIAVCERYLRRTCEAVALILDTADELPRAATPESEVAA